MSDTETQGYAQNNSAFRQLREAERAARKRARQAEQERDAALAELAAGRDQMRNAELEAEVESWGDRFTGHEAQYIAQLTAAGVATRQGARDWALRLGLIEEYDEEEETEPVRESTSFVPVSGMQGVAVERTVSYETWLALRQTDPGQADALFNAGKVRGLPKVNEDGTFDVPVL